MSGYSIKTPFHIMGSVFLFLCVALGTDVHSYASPSSVSVNLGVLHDTDSARQEKGILWPDGQFPQSRLLVSPKGGSASPTRAKRSTSAAISTSKKSPDPSTKTPSSPIHTQSQGDPSPLSTPPLSETPLDSSSTPAKMKDDHALPMADTQTPMADTQTIEHPAEPPLPSQEPDGKEPEENKPEEERPPHEDIPSSETTPQIAAIPEDPSPPETINAIPITNELTLTFTFPPESSELPNASISVLDSIIEYLDKDSEATVQIMSFAANKERDPSLARRLSLSRALFVRSYLTNKGVPPTRIEVRAMGDHNAGDNPDRVHVLTVRK